MDVRVPLWAPRSHPTSLRCLLPIYRGPVFEFLSDIELRSVLLYCAVILQHEDPHLLSVPAKDEITETE
jgi:hypothetical protein